MKSGALPVKRIDVAAAVIRQGNEVLLARRLSNQHQGGLWEFPGGKIEAGETPQAALARELEEELGIVPTAATPLIQIAHDYPDKSVRLQVWNVTAFRGQPEGREGQAIRWVALSDLAQYDFPAANYPIITAAQLPDCYAISPDLARTEPLLAWAEQVLQHGILLLLLRAPQLSRVDYQQLAEKIITRCQLYGARLMLHGEPSLLSELPQAAGVQSPAAFLRTITTRPFSADKWWAVSVHNPAELQQAQQAGADFVTLSPVQMTATHPEQPALGWAVFAEWAQAAKLPVYALGGMTQADLVQAKACGAQGIAAIRGLWNSVAE